MASNCSGAAQAASDTQPGVVLREPARNFCAFELGGHARVIVEESFVVGAAETPMLFVVTRDFFVIDRWHEDMK